MTIIMIYYNNYIDISYNKSNVVNMLFGNGNNNNNHDDDDDDKTIHITNLIDNDRLYDKLHSTYLHHISHATVIQLVYILMLAYVVVMNMILVVLIDLLSPNLRLKPHSLYLEHIYISFHTSYHKKHITFVIIDCINNHIKPYFTVYITS